jgi:RecJ-like exonuclease
MPAFIQIPCKACQGDGGWERPEPCSRCRGAGVRRLCARHDEWADREGGCPECKQETTAAVEALRRKWGTPAGEKASATAYKSRQ